MATVLIADDDASLRRAMVLIVCAAGFRCLEAKTGEEALRLIRAERPDVVVLDVMMPGLDGFEVCEQVRRHDQDTAILMLSAKTDIVDKKTGFRLGADDYLAKPFNEEELVLRIEALLRRRRRGAQPSADGQERRLTMGVVRVGELAIDFEKRSVRVGTRTAQLTPHEFDVLAVLAGEPGRVFTSEELITRIWGSEYAGESISIPVYVRRIRKKIEPDPSNPVYLLTVYHMGYRLSEAKEGGRV